MNDPDRNLTEADVKAIVGELKAQLMTDFYGEVGKGVWGWAKKVILVLLFLLAIQGIAGDRSFLEQYTARAGRGGGQ